ncbi:hypothetical protein PTQ19_10125 [Microbacterium esteraromaticum]|uniref:hypothetical protein n=1 Tax=Microbacterium esteraromaticum TaxID=57043 RepID=UPI002367439A|nr:hypothetical protein [Microbacterium esteraromaticum]WDH77877.1 hypothetical protein PTQ19_10125 [Microbacterium esteraromaticum]
MSALAELGRTLADLDDQSSWDDAHKRIIGSYLASSFAKPESVSKYVASMLAPKSFQGNRTTERGNEWEPLLLAFAGAEPNRLLIHSPENDRFAATVDGAIAGDWFGICETKLKHKQVITGPTPREVRQLAWQLICIPEAEYAKWVWGEVVPDETEPGGWRLRRDPQELTFTRDDPRIVAAMELTLCIAPLVLAAYDAALTEKVPF